MLTKRLTTCGVKVEEIYEDEAIILIIIFRGEFAYRFARDFPFSARH